MPKKSKEKRYDWEIPSTIKGKVDIIPHVPTQEVIAKTLLSQEFQTKITAGLSRVNKLSAESGILAFAKPKGKPGESSIYISPLVLGSSRAEDLADIEMGLEPGRASVDLVQSLSRLPQDISGWAPMIACHWHPSNMPFSQGDITSMESVIANQLKFQHVINNPMEIVCIPQRPRLQNQRVSPITQVTMLMIQPTQDTGIRHQAGLPSGIDQQVALFREDGFNVWKVVLPVVENTIDFSPLQQALTQQPPDQPSYVHIPDQNE